jgi:hypothetical protein
VNKIYQKIKKSLIMTIYQKIKQIALMELPEQLGLICYVLIILIILVAVFVLLFPGIIEDLILWHIAKNF